jgi:hypothetical protein
MVTQLVILSLATAIGWTVFRYIVPFSIHVRLAPFIITAIAYGLTFLIRPHPAFIVALAATGGVAIFNKITDATMPEAFKLPDLPRRNRDTTKRNNLTPHRIP